MKNNIKKLGRLWPLLCILAVSVAVLIFCIKEIMSPADSTSASQTGSSDQFETAASDIESISPSDTLVSASPDTSPDTSIPAESPSATAETSLQSPSPSPTPVAEQTPSPTPTMEVVTVIDNNIYEYTDNSYAHVDTGDADVADAAAQIIRLVNQERNAYGLSGLYYDDTLASVANLRVYEITSNFSHIRPNGSDCFSAFPSGYSFMGENLAEATGIISASDYAQGCVKYWMESPSHRENILNSNYTHTAVAVYIYDGCMYAVQLFGTPNS